MINGVNFEKIAKDMKTYDEKREALIKKSRDILKLSKQAIYAVHREDLTSAEKFIELLKKEKKKLDNISKGNMRLICSGTTKISAQEYVEAIAFFEFIKNKKLPDLSKLGVAYEHYLLGLCDLTGELVRKAINSAIKEDYNTTFQIKEFVSDLYGELTEFDFSNGELRKKYDSIKYDLKKLEDLVLEIKLKLNN